MALAATPGIFLANSGVLPASKDILPYPAYVKWYEDVHIPDWMGAKEGAITTAWRYQAVDEAQPWPFLVAYKYPDIAAMNAPEFRAVTLNHPSLPGGGPVSKFINIQISSGPHLETYRAGSAGDKRGPLLVTESIEPANMTTDEFHLWYRETYIYEIAKIDGWRRTSRFDTRGQPRWLTLHEFEERSYADGKTKITELLGESAEIKEVGKKAKRLDMALWRLVRTFGDENAAWGLPGTDIPF
ncbi:hypothetical protein OQA88_8711 [Cercophora sp. LCS_1]